MSVAAIVVLKSILDRERDRQDKEVKKFLENQKKQEKQNAKQNKISLSRTSKGRR